MRTEDGYIIQQCLDGNSATFAFLVDKYKSSVYALAYSEIHNFHDAQDITQEVFIKAFKNLNKLKRWDSFMGWLCRITINTCKNWIRSASRRPDSEFFEDQEKDVLGNRALESYQNETMRQSIQEALDSLPEIYSQVLMLRYFSGMTVKEISGFLGVSPRTVDRRISEAQSKLKEEILDMMETTKGHYNLPANFTIKIVEIVKNIRTNPIPQIKSLPWGFSLALGFIAIILSFGVRLNFQNIADGMSSTSSSVTELSLPKKGEYDIKMIEKPKPRFIPGQSNRGLRSFIPNPINASFFTAQPGKGQSPRENELIIYLSMDGKSETEALKNATGKDVKAIKNGDLKWKSSGGYDGKGAFEFDGNSDISLGDTFPTQSSYTKTVWIYWKGNGGRGAGNNIISGDGDGKSHALWCPETYGNKLSAGHNNRWNIVQDKEPLQKNRWYFVALTYDLSSKEMVLYKDAQIISSAKVSDADKDVTDATISIGSFGAKNGYMFQGLIDDVRIYKTALSENEIKWLFGEKPVQKMPEISKTKGNVGGFVIWESNRTGNWELYRANLDGSNQRQITELAKIYPLPYEDYLRPRISPDGKTVLFGYGKKGAPAEVWIMTSEGENPKKLTNGNPLNWSPDGKLIYLVRNSQIWQYDFKSGNESIIYDKKVPVDGTKGSMVGDIRRDLKAIVVRSDKSNEFFDFDKAQTVKTTGGCEPSFSSDGRYMYWVQGPKDFRVWDMENNDEKQFLGTPDYEKWNYTYFPRVSYDSNWIAYGASPDQHDHNTSDYEIFIQEMKDWKPIGKPIRISNDPHTDRWADIYVQYDDTPPSTPPNFTAKHYDQGVDLSWRESHDPESGVAWYNIYRDQTLLAQTDGTIYLDYVTNARTNYQYAVSAVNYVGLESPVSKSVMIKTKYAKPIVPVNLAITTGNHQANLKWDPNPELDITGYNIYRSPEPKGKFFRINKKIVPETSYVDDSVESGKTYYYCITAIDASKGESKPSEVVSKKILGRVTDGLLALYTFEEGNGNIAKDTSGTNPPMNLQIRDTNKIQWVKDENAIEFKGSSMIVSEGNVNKLLDNTKNRKELSIEVWLSPSNLKQDGPARIVSMSKDPGQRNFTLGQVGDDIAFRLRTSKTDQNGIPELDTKKHILSQQPTHIIATYDGNIKRLYINGSLYSETQQVVGDFSNWNSYPLVIGNELTGDRSWLGKLYLVSLYNRSLNSEEIIRNYQAGF